MTRVTHARRVLTRVFALVLVGVLALSLGLVTDAAPKEKGRQDRGKLSHHAQELLAAARAKGESTVTLLIASKGASNASVKAAIEGLGGVIRYREDSLDYLRAVVPTARAEEFANLAGIEVVDLDELIPLPDPRPEGRIVTPTPQPPPGAGTPNNNPYMPIGDTGASQFMAAHPTWDGRGITIGIVDTGVDLEHPSLQTTTTGERKIVDWVTGTDPRISSGSSHDPTWVNMATQVNVSGGSFTSGGVTYTNVAAPGTYRFGVFNEASLGNGSEYDDRVFFGPSAVCAGSDLNRNDVCNQRFAILWRASDNMVWVDSNADASFAGEPAMTDYKVRFDIGTFGTDNPATEIREAVPFVVQTDGKNGFVNIGIVSGSHGTHVAGIAAGRSLFGGAMSGAAPGAKIVSSRACLFVAGCTAHALFEGMIFVAKQSNVDVINMSIGGLPALNDGNNARAHLYNRLIEQFKVQMFISAGNSGPGLNTVGDPSVATKVMSVGSSITKLSWQRNYGADAPEVDNLHHFSSRGPREDGGFKPQIVAPGSAVSSIPRWQIGQPVGGTYTLPPGFGMFNGTSMSSPQAAGAAGLLVSAAKQTGVQHQPAQLRQAINSSARYFDPARFLAYDQGNGIFDVGAAWELLRTNIKTVDIESSVAVNTVLSHLLSTPNVGVGIHDREGVTAGSAYTRQYTFTRTSGPGGAVAYAFSWVGNDGTFGPASGTISLPKNVPVTLNVTVNPAASGMHAAILNLNDPSTAGIEYQTMNVVVAADQFNVGNNFSHTKTGTLGRSKVMHYAFNIPANTPAFKVDLSGPSTAVGTGQLRFLRIRPIGIGFDSNAVSNCYLPPQPGQTCDGASRTLANPEPGVWEVSVDARRTSDSDTAAFTLNASILGVDITPSSWTIDPTTVGTTYTQSFTFTNRFGTFTGRAAGTKLDSAFAARPTIGATDPNQVREVIVPSGASRISASISNPSDSRADLDLFLFNCTTGSCVLVSQGITPSSIETVSATNPAAGLWRIEVEPFGVPAGSTAYDYIDLVSHPTLYGAVTVADADAAHPNGDTWTRTASAKADSKPAAGRFLRGFVEVRSGTTVLGSAEVRMLNVGP